MIVKRLLALFSIAAIGTSTGGCKDRTTSEFIDDTLWANGELRVVVHNSHYVAPAFNFHGSGTRTKQEWDLLTIPLSGRTNDSTKRRQVFRLDGDYDHFFLSIKGSDLLLHQVLSNMSERQLFLFDPKTGKDVSKAFPTTPTDRWRPNRSRTAALMSEGKQLVIADILSAAQGEPKILARPSWVKASDKLQYGEFRAVLADDARHLVLFPYTQSGRNVGASNYVCEVWAIDGSVEKFLLPVERREGDFVDAELINGKVLLLWQNLLSNGAENGVELINTAGETLHSGKISAFTATHCWNIDEHELLFPCYEGSRWDSSKSRTFYVWKYFSNSVQRITVKR